MFSGSLALFIIDLRKYVLSHSHSHSHKHQHRKKQKGANRPRTPKVASEPNTDGAGGGSVVVDGEICRIDVDGIEVQPDEDEEDPCPPSCKVFHLLLIKHFLSQSITVKLTCLFTHLRVVFEEIHWPKRRLIFRR